MVNVLSETYVTMAVLWSKIRMETVNCDWLWSSTASFFHMTYLMIIDCNATHPLTPLLWLYAFCRCTSGTGLVLGSI